MSAGKEKLAHDLEVLSAMADGMDDYLKSDILFWKMPAGDMPMLTLGGYLMRQHRLVALPNLLSAAQQKQLDEALRQFNAALVEKIVRFETKAHKELDARLRQMDEYLRDLRHRKGGGINYETAVEPRAMIAALIERLQVPPYHLDAQVVQRIGFLDQNLRRSWTESEFIWPEDWQPAYPRSDYWWLYGRPT